MTIWAREGFQKKNGLDFLQVTLSHFRLIFLLFFKLTEIVTYFWPNEIMTIMSGGSKLIFLMFWKINTVLRTYKERTYKGHFIFFKKIYCARLRDKFLLNIIFNQKIW